VGRAGASPLESPRIQATLLEAASKAPFRIHAQRSGIDPNVFTAGPVTLRFGALPAPAPAGAFRRHGRGLAWRTNLFGVKKVTINVKNATLDVVGGNLELGPLPGPVTLAIETASGLSCGRVTWTSERTVGRRRRPAIRKLSPAPLGSCLPPTHGLDRIQPLARI